MKIVIFLAALCALAHCNGQLSPNALCQITCQRTESCPSKDQMQSIVLSKGATCIRCMFNACTNPSDNHLVNTDNNCLITAFGECSSNQRCPGYSQQEQESHNNCEACKQTCMNTHYPNGELYNLKRKMIP
ncbi:uncharacterized protein LOC144745773 [Ciona intestinalis]